MELDIWIVLSFCLGILNTKHFFMFAEGPGAGEVVNGTDGTVYISGRL